MNYDSKTTGRILNAYVLDMEQFNTRIASGQSFEVAYEATHDESDSGRKAHYIYQYEVDGVTYTRASEKMSKHRNINRELKSKIRHPFTVVYNSADPFISELGDQTDIAPNASKHATLSLILAILSIPASILRVPGFILAIAAIIMGSKSISGNIQSKVKPIIAIVLGSIGLLFSSIVVVFVAFFQSLS